MIFANCSIILKSYLLFFLLLLLLFILTVGRWTIRWGGRGVLWSGQNTVHQTCFRFFTRFFQFLMRTCPIKQLLYYLLNSTFALPSSSSSPFSSCPSFSSSPFYLSSCLLRSWSIQHPEAGRKKNERTGEKVQYNRKYLWITDMSKPQDGCEDTFLLSQS